MRTMMCASRGFSLIDEMPNVLRMMTNSQTTRLLMLGALFAFVGCSGGGASDASPDASSGAPPGGPGGTDAGLPDGLNPDSAGIVGAPPGAKRVFITEQTFQGKLGGLSGADGLCIDAAGEAKLGGAWKAWLSSTSVNAIDRVSDVGPWYDLGGSVIFAGKASLATSPIAALWRDERGGSLASDRIWTGTGFGGEYVPDLGPGSKPCADWTSMTMAETAKIGQVGRRNGAAWTAYAGTTCDQQAHLMCLEQ